VIKRHTWIYFLTTFALTCLLVIINAFYIFSKINKVPFAYDEPDYVSNAFLLGYLDKPSHPIWQNQIAIDQPHLYHYLCGIFLQITNHQPIITIIKENQLFSLDYPTNHLFTIGNDQLLSQIPSVYQPAFKLVLQARQLSFIFYILSSIILIIILSYLGIKPFFYPLLLIIIDIFVFPIAILSQADGLLILLLLTHTLFSVIYLSKPYQRYWLLPLIGIVCGLATSTKLNGVLTLFSSFLLIIHTTNLRLRLQIIIKFFIILMVCFITFIFFNPYLFLSPWQNSINMFLYRFGNGQYATTLFPAQTFSPNMILKFYQYFSNTFSPPFSLLISLIICLVIIFLSLISIVKIIKNKKGVYKIHTFILFNSLLTSLAIFFTYP